MAARAAGLKRMPFELAHLVFTRPFASSYRPAPPPDDPIVKEARTRAWRDRDAGTGPDDWPIEQREAWKDDHKAHHALVREYRVARYPDRLSAPAAWYDEIVVIAAGTLLLALTPDADGWRSAILVAFVAAHAQRPANAFGTAARRRSARRHGLTIATAPRRRWPEVWTAHVAGSLAYSLWRRARHAPRTPKYPWELWLANSLVAAVNERRSWRRAYRG